MQRLAMKSGSSLPMRSAARTHAARRGVVLRSTQGPFSSWPRETADRESAEANVGEFCSINKVEKSLGEMEQEFLQALASYYNEGKAIMSDEEFSLLKEELLWKGSTVPVLDGKEQRFLEAAQAYSRGQPIISDQAFDALKADLKANNSIVTAQGPRCSIRSRKMYSDLEVDYLKMTLLNVPGVLIVLAVMFGADYLSGFEITKAIELPPPLGIGLLWGFVLPAAYVLSNSITNILLKDALILKGKCPNCSNEVSSYFGEVMTVSAPSGMNLVDCPSCAASLVFDSNKRIIVLDATGEERAAAAGASAPAAGAKKKRAPAADE